MVICRNVHLITKQNCLGKSFSRQAQADICGIFPVKLMFNLITVQIIYLFARHFIE